MSGAPQPLHEATPSVRLRRKIDLLSQPYRDAWRRLVTHPRVADPFREHLVITHCIIRATVPLMEATIARARETADTDRVAADVAAYLEKHVLEETDHDEWLLEDLGVVGVKRDEVLARLPSATVASLVGSQYYWALHYHPVALLGYLAFMEGSPPTPRWIETMIVRTGYPREAFRTLSEHGELDPHHRDELDRTIDSMPLTREQEAVLGLSAMCSVDLRTRSIREVVDDLGTR